MDLYQHRKMAMPTWKIQQEIDLIRLAYPKDQNTKPHPAAVFAVYFVSVAVMAGIIALVLSL